MRNPDEEKKEYRNLKRRQFPASSRSGAFRSQRRRKSAASELLKIRLKDFLT